MNANAKARFGIFSMELIMMKKWTHLLSTALLVTTLSACVSTQSINQEAEQSYLQIRKQAGAQGAIDRNSNTAKRIHAVFEKMKPYAERANKTGVPFHWEITVLRSNELNAWAMPGGKMAFYTGLVEKLQLNDDEIAVVMGHEMAHALQEHGKSDRTLSTVTGIATQIGNIGLQAAGINTGGLDVVGTIADLGVNKPFSRSQETEADEVGLMLSAEAGYNPEYAPKLWAKMSEATGGGSSIFSTHPSSEDRQANLKRLVPQAMERYKASQAR